MYTDIKTFEDACQVLNLEAATVIPDFSFFPEKDREPMKAHAKLVIIAKALNGDWVPDWSNGKWDKYYPWFVMGSASGSVFSYDDCVSWAAISHAGSRLCFKTRELAEYAGKQFEHLYRDYFVIE